MLLHGACLVTVINQFVHIASQTKDALVLKPLLKMSHINGFTIAVGVNYCNKRAGRAWIPHRKTSGTEPKCKLMLAKSLQSAHKIFGADRSSIFRVIG